MNRSQPKFWYLLAGGVAILLIVVTCAVALFVTQPRIYIAQSWDTIARAHREMSAADWATYKRTKLLGTYARDWSGVVTSVGPYSNVQHGFTADVDGDAAPDVIVAASPDRVRDATPGLHMSFSGQIILVDDSDGGLLLTVVDGPVPQ